MTNMCIHRTLYWMYTVDRHSVDMLDVRNIISHHMPRFF